MILISSDAEALTDPATWTTSGNYARGCATSGPCGYATDCQSNSITYDDGKTSFCNVCRTMTIFQTAPYATPSASNIFCAENWVAFTVFRELPATTTSSDSSTITTSAASSSRTVLSTTTSSETLSTTPSTAATATRTAQASGLPTTTETSGSSSKAWIAGVVVGPVVGVALIAAIVGWLIYRRKQRQQKLQREQPLTNENFAYRTGPYKQPQEMDTVYYPPVHELSSYAYK
ncbi:hypothetical protein N7475_001668 [Penicillium sp. IBT 31633x]|nr:hypothetical protein N7475_001668 [Penicillium sp. IBT 31633x]